MNYTISAIVRRVLPNYQVFLTLPLLKKQV